jgi:hypothetical protein
MNLYEVSKPILLYMNHSKSFMEVPAEPPKKAEHPMDCLVKDDKRKLKKKRWKKCFHTWKELDNGQVHKGRYGVAHIWFVCNLCKRKQRRNVT